MTRLTASDISCSLVPTENNDDCWESTIEDFVCVVLVVGDDDAEIGDAEPTRRTSFADLTVGEDFDICLVEILSLGDDV